MIKILKYPFKTEDVFLFFCVILFIWIRFHHFNIVLERDEGEYAYAAQEILRGKLPYKDFYNMKFPGVYYFNAFIFFLFSDSVPVLKIILLLLNFCSACFIYGIARRWYNKQIGKLSAGIFLIFCSCYAAQGWTANAEHYVVFFGMTGIFFSSLFFTKNNLFYFFLAGFFLACATLCKQQGIFYATLPLLQWVFTKKYSDARSLNNTRLLKSIAVYVFGFMIPIVLMLIYFYEKNILNNFYFFTIQYASFYGNQITPFKEIWHFRPIFWDAFGFWILFFSMGFNAIKSKSFLKTHLNVFLFFGFSFAATSIGWYYRAHYFQFIFPAAAIMSAFMVYNVEKIWRFKHVNLKSYLVLSFIAILVSQSGYIFLDSNEKIMENMYPPEDFFNEKKLIANKINEEFSGKNYKIGIIGNEPEIFFYTKKQSASGFMYIYALVENHKFADSLTLQFFKEMEISKPEILMYFTDYKISPENPKTVQQITDWYKQFKQNYTPIGKLDSIGNKTKLIWRTKEKSTINADSAFYGVIYLRKDLEIGNER